MRDAPAKPVNLTPDTPSARRWLGKPVLFPNAYTWLLLVSALDGMATYIVLSLGGVEVNPIADAVLSTHGFAGMIAFKFALITLVIVFCEHIGQHRPGTALAVAGFGIAVTCIPVIWAVIEVVSAFRIA